MLKIRVVARKKRKGNCVMAFTREFLKGLGIEGDNLEKIMAEYGKSHTETADLQKKVADLTEQNGSLQSQIDDRDKQLTELKKAVGDNDELKGKIKELQDANKQAAADYQSKLTDIKKSTAIKDALRKANVKDNYADLLAKNFDKSLIKFEDDKVLGIDDQLKNIKEKFADSFKTDEQPKPNQTQVQILPQGNPAGGSQSSITAKIAARLSGQK